MVTRITGRADNHDLEFRRTGEYWEAEVPEDTEDGTYIVDLWAWDEAGNRTYYTTVLMTVEAKGITVQVLSDPHFARPVDSEYAACLLLAPYNVRWEEGL